MVVDVLRATTSLAHAFAHGAARVIPVATPAEALEQRRRDPRVVLCGERDGRRIEGFELGNSPAEYTAEAVAGRTLVFASTNGSLALLQAASARRRLIGAFVNATATAAAVGAGEEVVIVCAGKLGRFSLEDAAFAGWLCRRWADAGAALEGPGARLALALAPTTRDEVAAIVQGSTHGRYLRRLGGDYARDIAWCMDLDRLNRAFEA